MKSAVFIIAFVLALVSTSVHAQDKSPRQSVEGAQTLAGAVDAFEVIAKQRTSTQARASALKSGVTPVTRDWEIDSAHLIRKSRELSKLKGAQREQKAQEVIDHALRLLANDARAGNEDRERETFDAVRGVLTALVNQK